MKRRILSVVVAVFSLACNDGMSGNPMMPSQVDPSQVAVETTQKIDLSMWSPYILVHTPGEALRAYQKAIPELMARGALKGVRIGIDKNEGRNFVNTWIASVVPDTLWILDNHYLFDQNIEQVIDQVMVWYPGIKYLQIGNETTTILPRNEPQIPIELYMSVLKRIYTYVQTRYRGVILVAQSTFGSGKYGSLELERMVELGLREMSPNKLIIAMNVYSISAAHNYSHVVNRLGLRKNDQGYRIWVTESGVADPSLHISFVQEVYPFLKNNLKAERVYWYCLYCGEPEQDRGDDHSKYGLIRGINNPLLLWTSPLYNALTGR
ncbi:MAG: hypothetical protein Q8R55_07015 [Candidatus Taylorbacteria bacterium]|nr:hypothetical protein [Candidatus Taylorbacteria bacterium]